MTKWTDEPLYKVQVVSDSDAVNAAAQPRVARYKWAHEVMNEIRNRPRSDVSPLLKEWMEKKNL